MFRKRTTLLVVILVSLAVVIPVFAAAPSTGTVIEGVSVPGIALGDTRVQVETVYGQPESCTNMPYYDGRQGINGYCDFKVDGGGQVTVAYFGPDGGPAQDSPDDVLSSVSWSQAVSGWVTTAGVNTTLALSDPQAVIDAYPNAEVTYQGDYVYRVRDPELGISIVRSYDVYGGFITVYMGISNPYTPPPPPDKIRVADIKLTGDRHSVTARVLVLDDLDKPVSGAFVEASWYYLRADGLPVSADTADDGYATFVVNKAQRGNYYLYINNVTLDGYVYDYINSTTLGAFSKLK
jgi:hypothetical protein